MPNNNLIQLQQGQGRVMSGPVIVILLPKNSEVYHDTKNHLYTHSFGLKWGSASAVFTQTIIEKKFEIDCVATLYCDLTF